MTSSGCQQFGGEEENKTPVDYFRTHGIGSEYLDAKIQCKNVTKRIRRSSVLEKIVSSSAEIRDIRMLP